MRGAPGVSWIETDDEIAAPSVDSGVVNKKSSRTVNSTGSAMLPYDIQRDPPRGLDRIGQRLPLANNQYAYSGDGSGVHVYVIDSGIRATHVEFGNRVRVEQDQWYNATSDSHGVNGCLGRGHGTHVAGIIGGKTYGAAKNVTLHPVRVFGCAPTTPNAMVVAGVDWATKHHVTAATKVAAVANLSLGYDIRDPLDLREALYVAVKNSIDTGITYVVAAGNSAPIAGGGNKDACYITPARVPGAITVGATVPGTDYKALISNVGQCIDLFAPGTRIESAWNTGDHDHVEAGGTSMAAPHVAGIAALFLQSNPNASPADVWAAINAVANNSNTLGWCGVINRGTGSPNILLHWGAGSKDGAKDIEKDLPGQDPCPNFSEGVRRAAQSPR
jgi:subtilisin family serine protease